MGREGSGVDASCAEEASSETERGLEVDGDERGMHKRLLPLLSSESSDGMEERRGGAEVQQGC